MPYRELRQAGLNPDTDLEFRYSREHPATVKLVELGIVDAGAVDESILNAMIQRRQGGPEETSRDSYFQAVRGLCVCSPQRRIRGGAAKVCRGVTWTAGRNKR